MEQRFDFIIIGSGIAGLTFALKVSQYGRVLLATKSRLKNTGTRYAQGGISAVLKKDQDEIEAHVKDTLVAGGGISDEKVVRFVVEEAQERIKELIDWGVKFDKKEGTFDLHLEGGHSRKRILHIKDQTGLKIEEALISRVHKEKNIVVRENYFAVDIITQHHLGEKITRKNKDIECYGAYFYCLENHAVEKVLSKVLVMATGGSGEIYQNTTNPEISTGDGVAMTYRAKGTISHMEFYQFHPTALYAPAESHSFLISEAVRGAGAKLRNIRSELLAHKYHPKGELAPRDVVARAIDQEMKKEGSDYVYMDCTEISEGFSEKFPSISKKLKSLNIDISEDYIPIVPAAHYQCGGILVDAFGKSSIRRLYAIGECAYTGLHGANRLASNSLLEGVVFAHRAYENALQEISKFQFQDAPKWDKSQTIEPEEKVLVNQNRKEVKQIMANYVGIVRSDQRLAMAFKKLDLIHREVEGLYRQSTISPELCELRNMINISYLVIKMSMNRKKSIGLYYNIDHAS